MPDVVPSHLRRPVVVAVDGSRGHLSTVDLAVVEATLRRAPLLLVHVWPGRYTGTARSQGVIPSEADGHRLLEVTARRAAQRAPGIVVDTHLSTGGVAGVLVERSAAAQLLVVGHRDGAQTRMSWGSTAAYLAHHARCPLLVNRGAAPERGPVVLAASGRAASPTVACAYAEAATRGDRLVAVHVVTEPDGPGSAGRRAEHQAAEHQLAEALAGWAGSYPDVPVQRVVLADLDVAYTVERASRRGQLLVAGMGRTGRFAEVLYGSLARPAPCPVLLVPPGWTVPATPAAYPAAASSPRPID